MRTLKGAVVVATTAMVLGTVGGVAHATPVKLACVVSGELKARDKQDPALGVRLVGGKSSLDGNLFHVCAGHEKGVPSVQLFDTRVVGVQPSLVCGTAKAVLAYSRVDAPPKYVHLLLGQKFGLELAAFTGPFYWHTWAKPALPDLKLNLVDEPPTQTIPQKPAVRKRWQAAGYVVTGPAAGKGPDVPDPVDNHCMKAFSVSGAMVIDS